MYRWCQGLKEPIRKANTDGIQLVCTAIQCGLRYNWEATVGLYLLSSSMYLVPSLLSDLLDQHFPSSSHSLFRDTSSYSQLTCLLFREAFLPKRLDSGSRFILLSSQDFRFERTHLRVNHLLKAHPPCACFFTSFPRKHSTQRTMDSEDVCHSVSQISI